MSEVHPAFEESAMRELRAEVGAGVPVPEPLGSGHLGAPPDQTAAEPADLSARARRVAKRGVQRAIAWYVDPTATEAALRAEARVIGSLSPELDELHRRLDDRPDGIDALTINLELLKGELRALQATLEELGMAIAPATGLAGAKDRLAELRERIHTLERRTRHVSAPTGPLGATPAPAAADPTAVPAAHRPASAPASRFDYLGFERRFRGEREAVLETQRVRYLELLRHHAPVLDVGCGRGELLAVLAAEGIEAVGVDLEAESVAEAAAAGLDARVGDAVAFLRDAEPGHFGAVVSFHVVEHLRLEPLVELIELSAARLRPGGVFVAETPNPASLVVLGNSYVLDPTHERPLHPSLMTFLCEGAGFRDVRLEYFAPAESYQLPLVSDPGAPRWVEQVNEAFRKLNHVLFGPQEYAVIATTPPLASP